MGRQRRLEELLRNIGIQDETKVKHLREAIEVLESAGDDYDNALWPWLTQVEGTHFDPEEVRDDLLKALAAHGAAVGRILSQFPSR